MNHPTQVRVRPYRPSHRTLTPSVSAPLDPPTSNSAHPCCPPRLSCAHPVVGGLLPRSAVYGLWRRIDRLMLEVDMRKARPISLAFSILITPSDAFLRLLNPTHAFSRLLTGDRRPPNRHPRDPACGTLPRRSHPRPHRTEPHLPARSPLLGPRRQGRATGGGRHTPPQPSPSLPHRTPP